MSIPMADFKHGLTTRGSTEGRTRKHNTDNETPTTTFRGRPQYRQPNQQNNRDHRTRRISTINPNTYRTSGPTTHTSHKKRKFSHTPTTSTTRHRYTSVSGGFSGLGNASHQYGRLHKTPGHTTQNL